MAQLPDSNIFNLTPLPAGANPAKLWAMVFWEDGPEGSYRTPANSGQVFSNTTRGGAKIVAYLDSRLPGVPDTGSSLDRLGADSLCLLTEAWVLNPSGTPALSVLPPAKYILQPVAAGTFAAVQVFVDADPATVAQAWAVWTLAPSSHLQNTDTGTTGNSFTIQQDSSEQGHGLQRTLLGFGTGLGGAVCMLAYRWQNADDTAAAVFEYAAEYDPTPGAANTWLPLGQDFGPQLAMLEAGLQDLQAKVTAILTGADPNLDSFLEALQLFNSQYTLYQQLQASIGPLANLQTTAKGDLVAAINELAARPIGPGPGAGADTALKNTLPLEFTEDAHYTPQSGTLTIDVTGAKRGATLRVPITSPLALPANCQVVSGDYLAQRDNIIYLHFVDVNTIDVSIAQRQ